MCVVCVCVCACVCVCVCVIFGGPVLLEVLQVHSGCVHRLVVTWGCCGGVCFDRLVVTLGVLRWCG